MASVLSQSFGSRCESGVSVPSDPALPTRISSFPQRSKIVAPSRSMAGRSVRSNGTSVALPPTFRISSSTSSSPPTVRATRITCALSAAMPSATARPMPRDAPVMTAMRSCKRPVIQEIPSGDLGEKRQLTCPLLAVAIDKRRRIVAGETMIRELRMLLVAMGETHGAIEPVHGDECQAVDADIGAHAFEVVVGSEKLVALRRVDAVEIGVGDRRACDAQMHFLRARFIHHLHDLDGGRPPHQAVVHENDALAVHDGAVRIVFELHAELANMLRRFNE